MTYIDTDEFSERLRTRAILLPSQKILITRLSGSEQEKDLTSPPNCNGYGRIRHFKLTRYNDWSINPLPILPAAKALNYEDNGTLRAQVFQNSACNWRCWYCFVDFDRLSANTKVADYFTATELIQMYLKDSDRASVIDLTGGQPDLVPEWVYWIMQALETYGLSDKVFLWSDDNLSNRYFWRFLSREQRLYMSTYPKYSRVACFKGFDEESFSFNTLANPSLFNAQFEIFRDLLAEGIDMYAYATFTSPPNQDMRRAMSRFVDRLQEIHFNLPLRTVPLKIEVFSPTRTRIKKAHEEALQVQIEAHAAWVEEVTKRFTLQERSLAICDVPMYR